MLVAVEMMLQTKPRTVQAVTTTSIGVAVPSDRVDTSWVDPAMNINCKNTTIPDAVPVNVGCWAIAAACECGMTSPCPSERIANGPNIPNMVIPIAVVRINRTAAPLTEMTEPMVIRKLPGNRSSSRPDR